MKAKTFTGEASAVIPTAISASLIKPYQTSQQSVVGKEVTVKASVTVPEGQSKAGIPVTFVIDNNKDNNSGSSSQNQGSDKKVEVFTDANGEASYTYTQYVASEDSVTAYPTGAPAQRSLTKVYWSTIQPLTVLDVTEGSTLANNGKKVYKIKSTYNAGSTVNVTFAENVNVTPDKIKTGASVVDAKVGATVNPYQTTNSQVPVKVQLDANGEATFTVSGSNVEVTPVVFVDSSNNDRLEASELQATASTVKFDVQHTIGLDVKSVGTRDASYSTATQGSTFATSNGGRKFAVTVTDKAGNKAPANTPVKVTFKSGNATTNANFAIYDADGNKATVSNGVYSLVTNKDGVAEFTVTSNTKDSFATPTVFVDNGSKPNELDTSDLQQDGELTYFGTASIKKAQITVLDANGNEVTELLKGQTVTVEYKPVDQNGFSYIDSDVAKAVTTFEFNTTFGDLSSVAINGAKLGTTQKYNETVGPDGVIKFDLTSDRDTTLNILASSSDSSVANVSSTIKFVGANSALDYVNAAKTAEALLKALNADDSYAAQLKGLSTAKQLEVAQEVLDARPATGYSAQNLANVLKVKADAKKKAVEAQVLANVEQLTNASTEAQVLAALDGAGITYAGYSALDSTSKGNVINAVKGLATGDSGLANIAALQKFVDDAIKTEQDREAGAAITAALGDVNAATDATSMKAALTVANLKALGLATDLSAAELTFVAGKLDPAATYNAITIKTAFNNALTQARVTAAPGVKSVTLNAAGTSLVIEFDKDVTASAAIATADFKIKDATGTVVPLTGKVASLTGNKLTITVAPADGVSSNVKLTDLVLNDSTSTAVTINTDSVSAKAFTADSNGYAIVAQ